MTIFPLHDPYSSAVLQYSIQYCGKDCLAENCVLAGSPLCVLQYFSLSIVKCRYSVTIGLEDLLLVTGPKVAVVDGEFLMRSHHGKPQLCLARAG